MEGPRDRDDLSGGNADELERRALTALRSLRADRAPERLRTRIEAMRERSRVPQRRPRVFIGTLSGAFAAALIAALVLLLPSGTPGAPSVSQAALLAGKGPALAAPAPDPVQPATRLHQRVGDVFFPNWKQLGWHATGQRIDRLGGHTAVTVFYQHDGRSIAYTILATPPLRWPGTSVSVLHGITFQSLSLGSRMIVTWRRAGHTCVLSGAGASVAGLTALAAWNDPPADPAPYSTF
jgi:hypothetical protein